MVALLKDPVFWGLRTLVDEHPLSWDEFEQLEMPADLTRTQTWDILNALRRQTAIELPFRDGEGRCGWYYPTRSITADLDDIDKRCHEGSWLDLATRSRNTVYFLVEAHVDEAIATLGEDGLAIGYEKAREVLLAEREPESPEERLLLNWQRATWDIEELVDEPCTPETILGVYDGDFLRSRRADHPFAAAGIAAVEAQADRPSGRAHARGEDHRRKRQCLRRTSAAARTGRASSVHERPAAACLERHRVLAHDEAAVQEDASHVLALVPIVKASREWERGVLRPPAVMASIEDAEVLIDGEVDYTIHIDVTTQLVRRKLDEVETELKRMLKRDEAFVRALRNDLNLNHRQRAVLQAALSNPEAVFRIESHQKTHRVAYATARADLYGLVDLGFLGCVRAKRAFEFPVTPGLRQLLMGPGWKNRP